MFDLSKNRFPVFELLPGAWYNNVVDLKTSQPTDAETKDGLRNS